MNVPGLDTSLLDLSRLVGYFPPGTPLYVFFDETIWTGSVQVDIAPRTNEEFIAVQRALNAARDDGGDLHRNRGLLSITVFDPSKEPEVA